jgi:hypothetical protein
MVRRAIARFFDNANRDDLLVFYFSGHGIKDDSGQLYLAVKDTERALLTGTGIESAFITARMDRSRSRRQVLILDCVHGGAFWQGDRSASSGIVPMGPAFEGIGSGRVILTATDSSQYAWEGDQGVEQPESSVFTHYLVQGLKTGDADLDGDGVITIDELYDYVYKHVTAETPTQTPGRWNYKQNGDIVIALNANRPVRPAEPDPFDLRPGPPPQFDVPAESIGSGEVDPLELLKNLPEQSPPRTGSSARDLDRGKVLDEHYSPPAALPAPAAASPPQAGPIWIPPDYDPLAPDEPAKPLYFDDNVQFTVYRPQVIQPAVWYPLLAFAHLSELPADSTEYTFDPVEEVREQAGTALGEAVDDYGVVSQDSHQAVPRGGELTFVPEVAGIEFNPRSVTFLWCEPVHKVEFHLRALPDARAQIARGRLTVFLGGIILADITLAIRVAESRRAEAATPQPAVDRARPYRKIFASYSHLDRAVVEEYDRHAQATGDRYLRDVIHLRTGESWHARLMQMIDEADLFQLFWSWNAMASEYVRREWAYALSLDRPYFVRPVYWEEPLPRGAGLPPPALERLHFQRIYPSAAASPAPLAETTDSGNIRRTVDVMLAEASRHFERDDCAAALAALESVDALDPHSAAAESLRHRIRDARNADEAARRRAEAKAREHERREAEARERRYREEQHRAREAERLLAKRSAAEPREQVPAALVEAPLLEPDMAAYGSPFPAAPKAASPRSNVSRGPMVWAALAFLVLLAMLTLAFC